METVNWTLPSSQLKYYPEENKHQDPRRRHNRKHLLQNP